MGGKPGGPPQRQSRGTGGRARICRCIHSQPGLSFQPLGGKITSPKNVPCQRALWGKGGKPGEPPQRQSTDTGGWARTCRCIHSQPGLSFQPLRDRITSPKNVPCQSSVGEGGEAGRVSTASKYRNWWMGWNLPLHSFSARVELPAPGGQTHKPQKRTLPESSVGDGGEAGRASTASK